MEKASDAADPAHIPRMLGLLVFLPLVLLAWWLRGQEGSECWRSIVVRASVVWAAGIVLGTELLSAARALEFFPVAVGWIAINVVLLGAILRRPRGERRRSLRLPDGAFERGCAAMMAGMFTLTLVVSLLAPPNTSDALSYHLPRQLMWMQQHSLAHFHTADARALMMFPAAEIIQVHGQILSGGDAWANLPQWIGYVLGAVAVSLLARSLGGSVAAQWGAALVFCTLPMAYHQASSAKNDLWVATWLTILAYRVLSLTRLERPSLGAWVETGAAAGLALATKATALIFVPLTLVLAIRAAIRQPRRALIGGAMALALVAPHAARNHAWFGTPMGIHRAEAGGAQQNERFTAAALASNVVRHATLHLAGPVGAVNAGLAEGVERFHAAIGQTTDDTRTTLWNLKYGIVWGPAQEAVAGAPGHFVIGAIALIVGLVLGALRRALLPGLVWAVGGGLLICFALKWQPWAARFHLPVFMILAAITGCVFAHLGRRWLVVAGVVCVLGWLPSIETSQRPLWTQPTLFSSTRWANYFRSQHFDRLLQEATLRQLSVGGIRSIYVLNEHREIYPLLRRFVDEGPRERVLMGATSGPTSTAPDAVVIAERLESSLPLYCSDQHGEGRYRISASVHPYGIYRPVGRGGAVPAVADLPDWLGWERAEGLVPAELVMRGDRPTAVRKMAGSAATLHFRREAPQMWIRLEARNPTGLTIPLEVWLNGRRVARIGFEAGGEALAVTIPLAPVAGWNQAELVVGGEKNEGQSATPPALLLSAVQIFDEGGRERKMTGLDR